MDHDLIVPELPKDRLLELDGQLNDLSSSYLTQFMYGLAAWSAYAEYVLALAETDYHREEAKYEVALSHAMTTSGSAKGSVAAKKAAAESDPDVVEYREAMIESKEKVTVMRAIIRGYDKKYNAVSRELSRRTGKITTGGF